MWTPTHGAQETVCRGRMSLVHNNANRGSQPDPVCFMGGQRGSHRSVSCMAGKILISIVEGTSPCGRLLRSGICM